jgi:putative NADH-flavin reductase
MQVTVLGANGKVGQLVVQYLLDDGYQVVALVHRQNSLRRHARLRVQRGDIHISSDIAEALQGSKAVVSCLSSWHASEKDILSSAIQNLVPVMRIEGISRIVSLTGAGAFTTGDRRDPIDRLGHAFFNTIAPKVLRDAEDHISLLRDSNLEWTVVRSPVMTESGKRKYELQAEPPAAWQTIHRHAVARCLADQVDSRLYLQEAPFIVRA